MTLQAISGEIQAISVAMKVEPPKSEADFAKHILSLQEHLFKNPENLREIKRLQYQNPNWIVLDFLKGTPPAQLDLDKLRKLLDLVLLVSLAADTQAHVDWIYKILEQIQFLEEKPGWLATAAGLTAASIAGFVNPWVAPLTGLAIGLTVRRATSGESLLQDRSRAQTPQYVALSKTVRMFFEPVSSGLWGRYISGRPSQTLGQIEIDLFGETFSCFFDNKKPYQIHTSELKRLHQLMLNMVQEERVESAVCLDSLETINPYLNDLQRGCLNLLKATCQKAASRPVKPLRGTVIDVPGFNNSCGLYSLALAAKKSGAGTLPAEVVNWNEQYLTSANKDSEMLQYLHNGLREMLDVALTDNQQFQHESRQNFISSCLTLLAQGYYPAEMEAFFRSNEPFITTVAKEMVAKLSADATCDYLVLFTSPATAISDDDISQMKQAMQRCSDFTTLFEPLFADTGNALHRIIKQQKLYAATWGCLPALSQRLKIQEEAAIWLQSKITLETTQTLALLSCTNFALDGFASLAHVDTLNAEILRFRIIALVNNAWPTIYKNYITYIRDANCMLTADELQVLAKSWNLKLAVVEWSQSAPSPLLPTIYLTNPSKYHWQVFNVIPSK